MWLFSAPRPRPTVPNTPISGWPKNASTMMLSTPRPTLTMAERRRLATASTGGAGAGCTVAINSLSQVTANSNDGVAACRHQTRGYADYSQYRRCMQCPIGPPTGAEADHHHAGGNGTQAEQARPGKPLRVVAHPSD